MQYGRTLLYAAMLCGALSSCTVLETKDSVRATPEVTASAYVAEGNSNGIVLLDVNWGRVWGCAKYENAQLISFGFDRVPLQARSNDDPADFTVVTPNRLLAKQEFESYAFHIPAGEYALSQVVIKIAQSASNIGYWISTRSDTLRNNKPYAGTFKIDAGEAVYIGNFGLDCFRQPTLWRYYTAGHSGFDVHLEQYARKYPFLNLNNVIYRLFETEVIGYPYELE